MTHNNAFPNSPPQKFLSSKKLKNHVNCLDYWCWFCWVNHSLRIGLKEYCQQSSDINKAKCDAEVLDLSDTASDTTVASVDFKQAGRADLIIITAGNT